MSTDGAAPDYGIDTTPPPDIREPEADKVNAAMKVLPDVLSDKGTPLGRHRQMVAHTLAKNIQKTGHLLAAAHYAIHQLALRKILKVGPVRANLPEYGNDHYQTRPMTWTNHGTGEKLIPIGQPTPYECFNVISTDALWEWWKQGCPFDVQSDCGTQAPFNKAKNEQIGETRSEGPISPNQFVWESKVTEMSNGPWKLVNFLWHSDDRKAEVQEVFDGVWGHDSDKSGSALKSVIYRANASLAEKAIPVSLGQKAGYVFLYVKDH